MAQKLHTDDAADIALVAEFGEYGICRTSHSVFEIYTIGKVGCYARSIYNDKQPFGCHLPTSRLFIV